MDETVARGEQRRFPLGVVVEWSFREDQPRAPAVQVEAAEHRAFQPFDVDLEEVDRPFDMGRADRVQGADLHFARGGRAALGLALAGWLGVRVERPEAAIS